MSASVNFHGENLTDAVLYAIVKPKRSITVILQAAGFKTGNTTASGADLQQQSA